MKRTLLLLVAVLSLYMTGMAQERRASPEKKGFLILSAGPSFPVGDFSSTDFLNNSQAAYAKTGFAIDLHGGYNFIKNFGLGGSIFYSHYSFDEQRLKDQLVAAGAPSEMNISVDHWQYYGLVVGPIITGNVSTKTIVDFSLMTGVARANSPKAEVSIAGTSGSTAEDWATAVPMKVSGGIRFQVGQNGYLFTGLDYMYMEPKFNFTASGELNTSAENVPARQKMTSLNFTVGAGIRF
ncbi:MAG: hypothetical protein ACHQF0_00170 [Chitinophagales bacterium]